MLTPITYAAHQVKEIYIYVIGINIILHNVFMMFVDFTNWMRGCIEGQPSQYNTRSG